MIIKLICDEAYKSSTKFKFLEEFQEEYVSDTLHA